ncbi:unnamed protein product, partial [Ectocarpus sp. 8 AP-2014]
REIFQEAVQGEKQRVTSCSWNKSSCGERLQGLAAKLSRGVVSRKSARGNHNAALTIDEQGIGVLLARGYADLATELGNVLAGILNDHELNMRMRSEQRFYNS